MIEAIRRIGKIKRRELDKDNFKEGFLQELSNPIKIHYEKWSKEDKENKPISIKKIILNLDLKTKEIKIKCDEDLSSEKQLVFSPASPNGGKINFNTNNLKYYIENTIPDLIRFIEEKIPNPEKYRKFIDYLKKYRDVFYKKFEKKDKKGKVRYAFLLNFDLVKDKEDCENFEEVVLRKLNIPKRDFKSYKTFFLYLDDKNVLNNKFKRDFLEIKYFQLVESFFEVKKKGKGVKEEKYFHLKDIKDKITNNIDILTKFYMTDKSTFFENFDKKNAYKSFSVNQKTYEELLLGVNEIWNSLNFYFAGLRYLLVPKSEDFLEDLEDNIKIIGEDLKKIEGNKKEYQKLEEISGIKDWSFDMLFYGKDQSAFNIFKIINDLSYFNLTEILKVLREIDNKSDIRDTPNKKLEENGYPKRYFAFNLNQFWGSIYAWTTIGKFKDKQVLYRTEFLDYLDCIYNRRKIKQGKLIKKILLNLKKHHYNKRNIFPLILNSFNSLIFLLKLDLIKNKKMEKEKKIFSEELSNKDIESFFEDYPEVFGNNLENGIEKQGLILLGYLVNQVIFSQGNRSKNFINKINFDGIKKDKLNSFILEVIEFLNIYSKNDKPLIGWNKKIILGMQERLINITKSILTREEITYYILFGNFLGAYIGIKKGTQKEDESNINEDELNGLEGENDNSK